MYVSILLVFLIGINLSFSSPLPLRKNDRLDDVGVHSRCVQNGTIALTFDDGPHEDSTPGVIDLLQSLNVPATFFVVGWRLHINAAIDALYRTHAQGHYVGSHTWNHPDLTQVDYSTILSEINVLSHRLSELINHRPRAMRPPYGAINDLVVDVIHRQLGYSIILWSIDSQDWANPGDTQAGLQRYIDALGGTNPNLTPGFIALHHDPLVGSVALAQATISYARSLGYRYVSLAECLGIPIIALLQNLKDDSNSAHAPMVVVGVFEKSAKACGH